MIITYQPSTRLRTAVTCIVLATLLPLTLTRESRAETAASPSLATPHIASSADALGAPTPVSAAPSASANLVIPQGWYKNGLTNRLPYYDVGVDPTQNHEGAPAVVVRSRDGMKKGFVGMMQMCRAEHYVGKRIRFGGWVKCDNAVDGGVHLWLRVDGEEHGKMLAFDNMDNRPIKGTTEWQHCSIVLDVPAGAEALAYGVFVSGSGAGWVSGISLEEVGPDVATTNLPIDTKPQLPEEPVNLSFQ